MTRVVHCRKEPYDVMIDRTTKWGNPFRITKECSREEAIELFREYVKNDEELMASLHEIRGKTLGCWCKPLACHGDVLAELADME